MEYTYYIVGSYNENESNPWSYLAFGEEIGPYITKDVRFANRFYDKEEAINTLKELKNYIGSYSLQSLYNYLLSITKVRAEEIGREVIEI